MYVHRKILEKVRNLFTEQPEFRDERWGTVVLISKEVKEELGIIDEIALVKIAFDVDRAFRYIQQHEPNMRGETWLQRQKKGGEYHGEIEIPYDKLKTAQMKLF
jgi:hypothetical protein